MQMIHWTQSKKKKILLTPELIPQQMVSSCEKGCGWTVILIRIPGGNAIP